jgi:hypothetical protein
VEPDGAHVQADKARELMGIQRPPLPAKHVEDPDPGLPSQGPVPEELVVVDDRLHRTGQFT